MALKRFYTKESMIKAIDDLVIYEDEYDLIMFLMDNLSGILFSRILEEILNGELSFSDFSQMFPNNEYSNLLESNLPTEKKLKEKLDRYKEFKKELEYNRVIEYDDKTEFKTNNIALLDKDFSNKVYNDEVKRQRDGMIYTLLDGINDDPILVQEVKRTLIKYLKEKFESDVIPYEEVIVTEETTLYETSAHLISLEKEAVDSSSKISDNNEFTEGINTTWISDKGMLVSQNYSEGFKISKYNNEKLYKNLYGNLTIKPRNIEPQDILNKILFFAEKEIIPLETENQYLTKEDQNFMLENEISIEEVKKIKALATFIRKKHVEVD